MASTAFEIVKYRMKARGIDLEKYVAAELNSWSIGFNFVPKSDWKDFAWALRNSGRFCIDTSFAAKLQKGALSWREIGAGDGSGMHVLFRKGKPYKEYTKKIIYFEIHIDSISPTNVQVNGQCSYSKFADWDNIWNHAAVDLLHLPVVLPDKEGFRIGIRF
jgi:hypothetical protein